MYFLHADERLEDRSLFMLSWAIFVACAIPEFLDNECPSPRRLVISTTVKHVVDSTLYDQVYPTDIPTEYSGKTVKTVLSKFMESGFK